MRQGAGPPPLRPLPPLPAACTFSGDVTQVLVQAPPLKGEAQNKTNGTEAGEATRGPSVTAAVQQKNGGELRGEPEQANPADGREDTRDLPRPRNLSVSRVKKWGRSLKYSKLRLKWRHLSAERWEARAPPLQGAGDPMGTLA